MSEATSTLPNPGEVIGSKYLVLGDIGRGGMSLVLEARHLELNEAVAIKVLLPEHQQNPDACERFAQEARAAARIKNEHVAHIYDVGQLPNGLPYIVMERLRGGDLSQLIAERGPLGLALTTELMLQLADALEEAHRLEIVHRDLKPANLFISWDRHQKPWLKLIDFGISKVPIGARATSVTQVGYLFGSPDYMSPEQIFDSSSVDTRTDVWSLGVILVECLTGELPFTGTSQQDLYFNIVSSAPKLPRAWQPSLPASIDELVLACLQRDPGGRIQTVAEWAAHLAEIRAAHVTSVPPAVGPPAIRSEPLTSARTMPPVPSSQGRKNVWRLRAGGLAVAFLLLLTYLRWPRAVRGGAAAGTAVQPRAAPSAPTVAVVEHAPSVTLPAAAASEPQHLPAASSSARAVAAARRARSRRLHSLPAKPGSPHQRPQEFRKKSCSMNRANPKQGAQRRLGKAAVALTCLVGTCLPRPAQADSTTDLAQARALFDEGRKLMKARDYAAACPKFEASARLDEGIGTRFNLADCDDKAGKTASAWALFLDIAAETKLRGDRRRESAARARVQELEPRLCRLTVRGPAIPDLTIRRDREAIDPAALGTPVPVDPGEHVVIATAPGREPYRQTINLQDEGTSLTIQIPNLQRVTSKSDSRRTPRQAIPRRSIIGPKAPVREDKHAPGLSYAAVGLGVVGAGVGSYFGLRTLSKRHQLEAICPNGNGCSPAEVASYSSVRSDATRARTWSIVGFSVGAVGLASALITYLTDQPATESTAAVSFAPEVDGALLGGSFSGRW